MNEIWENYVNTALLGTSKREFKLHEFDSRLSSVIQQIMHQNEENEIRFLRAGVFINQYRKASLSPLDQDAEDIVPCEPEILLPCPEHLSSVYGRLLQEVNQELMHLCLDKIMELDCHLPFKYLASSLNLFGESNDLKNKILKCAGNRGKWLMNFYSGTPKIEQLPETIFIDGNTAERLWAFEKLRHTAPDQARELLESTWKTEPAAFKTEVLKKMRINLSENDENFLITATKEKGSKVVKEAYANLLVLPNSNVSKVLSDFVIPLFKRKKGLLGGILGTGELEWNKDFIVPANFAQYGFDLLSINEGMTEKESILYQLIVYIQPSKWMQAFETDEKGVLSLFNQSSNSVFVPALCLATGNFRDIKFASEIYRSTKFAALDYPDLYNWEDKQKIVLDLIQNTNVRELIQFIGSSNEWSTEFTKKVVLGIMESDNQLEIESILNAIRQIPVKALDELLDMKNMLQINTARKIKLMNELIRLLELKKEITYDK
ncbi:MAG TPA: DUF5691 domain-containing protein [Bacteroidia bacterium]